MTTGRVLRNRYGLGVAAVGGAMSAFGVGLAVGNLLAGHARRIFTRDERTLALACVPLAVAMMLFMAASVGLTGALACLLVWGAALGVAAPASTAILARRAAAAKGQVLAASESINNATVLMLLPVAAGALAAHGPAKAAMVVGGCCLVGVLLTVADARIAE
ncbi:hypothetical protein [Cupriavidus necator]|uniref:hypothetical protein n=1 Tax=Cupriavidus necator TaxID=106590 RepID=UPI00339D9056